MTNDRFIPSSIDYIINTSDGLHQFHEWLDKRSRQYKPSRLLMMGIQFLSSMRIGKLDLVLPNNQTLRFIGEVDGPHATLHVHKDRVVRRFLTGGQLGFCEAYLDGDWSSPDIARFFELILLNAQDMREKLLGKTWYRRISWLLHKMKPNSRKGSKKNIYKHYDIGNDFYTKWLDPSMTYSSALFSDGIEDLEQAQLRKYEEMARRLDIKPEHHVLEIGCGWGGFAEYVAKNIGAKVTGITISEAQYEYATKRIKDAGLDDKVELRLQDYRELSGQYDRIASIEMFEAVGESYWPTFFGKIKSCLKPGGQSVLQIITIKDKDFESYRKSADYIQRYIFPGGMLPSPAALNKQIVDAGLRQGDTLSFGRDYARTLAEWNTRFQATWHKLSSQFDTRFKRLWEQYLCYCQAGFSVGTIDVIQITIHKDD